MKINLFKILLGVGGVSDGLGMIGDLGVWRDWGGFWGFGKLRFWGFGKLAASQNWTISASQKLVTSSLDHLEGLPIRIDSPSSVSRTINEARMLQNLIIILILIGQDLIPDPINSLLGDTAGSPLDRDSLRIST